MSKPHLKTKNFIGLLVNWIIGIYWIIGLFPSLARAAPLLKIVSPEEEQTILGDKVTISFIVGNINVGPDGHLHLWFDSPIEEATIATEITNQFDHTLSEIPPGPHKLTLEVVKPNNTSYNPQIKQSVHFTTKLPQSSSLLETPRQKNLLSFFSEVSWQVCTTILGILLLVIGIIAYYK